MSAGRESQISGGTPGGGREISIGPRWVAAAAAAAAVADDAAARGWGSVAGSLTRNAPRVLLDVVM